MDPIEKIKLLKEKQQFLQVKKALAVEKLENIERIKDLIDELKSSLKSRSIDGMCL